jgi:hypothetical protein
MRVVIDTVALTDMRNFPQCGDWHFDGECLTVKVAANGDWRSEMCIAVHEIVEALLCRTQDIPETAIDDFDRSWRPHSGLDEAGADPAAPYYMAHMSAMSLEHHLATVFGLPWARHEALIDEAERQARAYMKMAKAFTK